MTGRPAQIEARDGRRVRRPGNQQPSADHLLGMDEPVREVPVRRALHGREVLGREHRPLDDAVAQVGQELAQPVDDPLGHLVAQTAAVLLRRFAREEEAVRRRDVEAVGREARIHHGGDLHAHGRMLGHLAAPAGLVAGLLELGIGHERRVEARAGIGVQMLERGTVAGQAPQLEEQVHVGAALLDALDPFDGRRVEVLAPHQPEERGGLVEVREHRARRDAAAVAQLDADRSSGLDQHAPDRRPETHLAALLHDRPAEGLGQRAHAALHTPHEPAAFVLREGVDQAQRAARRERPLVRRLYGGERDQGTQRPMPPHVGKEPIDEVHRAPGEGELDLAALVLVGRLGQQLLERAMGGCAA